MQRERCRIDRTTPIPSTLEPIAFADAVTDLMKRLGLDRQAWLERLEGEWATVVGNAVAGHTRPGRLDGKRLIVFVDSSVWLHELTHGGQDTMLANLQKCFGADKVTSIRLQLDPGDGPDGSGYVASAPAAPGSHAPGPVTRLREH